MSTKTQSSVYFQKALECVQSTSIRQWASSDHNGPIWLQYVEAILKARGSVDVNKLAAYITLTAMG
jgi:hypothetical protein